jgi:superfamily II helicase
MLRMYCQRHHGAAALCSECSALERYAKRRLERCVFGDDKPTCANCLVHCYRADMRARVREMMRWAGPRMLLRHPVAAVLHMLDGRRLPPGLPRRR